MSSKWLKQSTAVTVKIGPFVDSTDGNTAETGLTISQADVRLSKQGGAFAQKNDSSACTHDENGYYDCALNATDTGSLGSLVLSVRESGALVVRHEFVILPANVHEALVAGSDKLEVDATLIEGVDATNQIRDAVVDDATRIDASALNTLSSHDPGEAIMGATDLGTGSGLTSLASASSLATVAGYLDTEVAAILAAVDTEVAAIKAKTDNLPSDPADASVVAGLIAAVESKVDTLDAVADAIKVATDKLDDTLEDDSGTYRFTQNALEEGPTGSSSADLMILHTGTAQAGTSDSITLASGASSVNDAYKRACISINSGTGAGQSGICSGYNGTTKVATMVESWAITPDSTSVVVVTPAGYEPATVDSITAANWAALRSENQVAGSFGESVNANLTSVVGDASAAQSLKDYLDGARLLFVDLRAVNGVNIKGAGTDADPWRAEGT